MLGQSLLQTEFSWRPDRLSLLVGVVLGVILTLLFIRVQPRLQRGWQRIKGWSQQRIAWWRAGLEVRYQAETAVFLQTYHLGRAWGVLEQVFVPPRLLAIPTEIDLGALSESGVEQLYAIWPDLVGRISTPPPPTINVRQLLLNGQRVLISNEAGSGKTTLLAYCAYRCATAQPGSPDEFLLPVTPLLVHLAELELQKETAESIAPLISATQKRSNPLTATGLGGLLRQKAKAGQLLLLLDGWDECEAAERAPTTEWLRRLLADFPGIQVVMAAPPNGYGPLLELDFTVTSILPWRPGQVEQFAAQWTKAASLSQPPKMAHYWQPGQSALENSLRFWLVAFAQNGTKERPKRRFDLLQTTLPLFSGEDVPDALILVFWRRLAYTLLTQGKLAMMPQEVTAVAEATPGVDKTTLSRLQKSIHQSSLFMALPNGAIRFFCPVWRNFLAACHLAQAELNEEILIHLSNPDWGGMWRFYVAQVGAATLANRLLEIKETSLTRETLFQVADWLPEASDDGEWRRQMLILLGQIIRQTSFAYALRQRAVAALAQTGEPGVFTFLTQLTDRSDPLIRQAGVAALPYLGPDKTVEVLTKMMEDGDKLVRKMAVSALAWLHHPLAERPLLTALVSNDPIVQQATAIGLALNGSSGVEILKEALEDEDIRVRRAAIEGLSVLDEAWVVPLLTEVERRDKEWAVRSAATAALEAIKTREKPMFWRPLPPSKQPWLVDYAAKEGRVVPDGAATRPFLVQILTDATSPVMRTAAAATLGHMAARDALPALETATRDTHSQVREMAFTTLCLIQRSYGANHVARPPTTDH